MKKSENLKNGWYRIQYNRKHDVWKSDKDFVYVKNGQIVTAKSEWGKEKEVKIPVTEILAKYMVIMEFENLIFDN